MNKFTLRFPNQLELIYQEATKNTTLMHFKTYQPILILINLSIAIIQLQNGQLINGVLLSIISIFFIIEIPYVLKKKCNPTTCNVFMINNLIMTGIQLLVDSNTTNYKNQYVSGCGITLINITLLEHYDFLRNAFTLTLVVSIRLIYIFFYFPFDGMVLLYIVCFSYMYLVFYRKTHLKRRLFLQYEYEQQIRKVLDQIIKEIYIHFKFDQQTFQFELKYANQIAENKMGISSNQNFKDYLHSFTVADNQKHQEQKQGNNNNVQKSAIIDSITLGQYLYEKMISTKDKENQLELTVVETSTQLYYKVKCYSYTVINKEIIILMELADDQQKEDIQLKQKNQEIKLLSSQLLKINMRTKKQLSQLCQILESSESRFIYKISDQLLSAQIISNTKIQMILDAFSIYYFKIDQKMDKFSINSLIYSSLIVMNTVADVESKYIYFDFEQSNQQFVTQKEFIVKFIFQSLLYLFIIQKAHKNIKITLTKAIKEEIICINFFVDGLISLEFLKQNTFIMQMVYKGLQLVGPKAEISTTADRFDDLYNPYLLQIKIYENLDFVYRDSF